MASIYVLITMRHTKLFSALIFFFWWIGRVHLLELQLASDINKSWYILTVEEFILPFLIYLPFL